MEQILVLNPPSVEFKHEVCLSARRRSRPLASKTTDVLMEVQIGPSPLTFAFLHCLVSSWGCTSGATA